MATRSLYTIGRDSPYWGNRFEPGGVGLFPKIGADPNRQLGFAQWVIPSESLPSAQRTIFEASDNSIVWCYVDNVGGNPTLRIYIKQYSGYDAEAQYDLSSIYSTGVPFFLYVQIDLYQTGDSNRLKVWINDGWVSLNFVNPGVPDGPLDLGNTTGAYLHYGQISSGAYGFMGRLGQIRIFHGDITTQDNPGLPPQSAIENLYYFGLGEPSSVAGQSGFDSLVGEYLLTEQTGATASDSSTDADATDFNVSATGIGWGGVITLEVSLQPKIDSISIVDGSTIDVIFTKEMKNNSILRSCSSYDLGSKYSCTAVQVINSTTVRLSITPEQHTGDSVTLTVSENIQDMDGNTMDPTGVTISFTAQGTHPEIVRATAKNYTIRVHFNKQVKRNDALEDKNSYRIVKVTSGAKDVSIIKVVPEPDVTYPTYVDLEVTETTPGALYRVEVVS